MKMCEHDIGYAMYKVSISCNLSSTKIADACTDTQKTLKTLYIAHH